MKLQCLIVDDESLARNAVLVAEEGIVGRADEGSDFESTEDAGVIFGATDACREIQLGHGGGGANEMGGELGRIAFGGCKNKVGQRSLKWAEGRAVDVMNDHRDSRARRRDAA